MSMSLRFRVLQRDNFRCRYCGRNGDDVVLEVDHIVPRSQGGHSRMDNLVTACQNCNRGKRDTLLSPEHVYQLQIRIGIAAEPSGLPVYDGGHLTAQRFHDDAPVARDFVYVGPDTFVGAFTCSTCGFYNTYEGDHCSCHRNGGYTNCEMELLEEGEPCDCYECDECAELRPDCVWCLEAERVPEYRVCGGCWEDYYGEPREVAV